MKSKRRKIIIYSALALILALAVFNILRSGKSASSGDGEDPKVRSELRDHEGGLAARLIAKKLYLRGLNLYGLRQFKPAIEMFELAVALDPACQAAGIKLASAKKRLSDIIERDYSFGLAEFRSLHYDRAIRAWRRVQQMLGDDGAELYKKAEKNIGLAEDAVERRLIYENNIVQ